MPETPSRHPSDIVATLFSEECTIVLRALGSAAGPLSAEELSEETQLKETDISDALDVLESHGVVIISTKTTHLNLSALVRAATRETTEEAIP